MQSFTLTIKNAASKLLSDPNFNFLLRSSSFNAGTKIIGTAFGFLASFLIARNYGPGMVGTIAAINSTFMLLSLCALFGNQIHIVKILPEYIEKQGYSAAWKIYKQFLTVTSILVIAALSFWTAIETASPVTLLRGLDNHTLLIAGLVALATYKRINTKTLRALGDYKIYSCFDLFTPLFAATIAITAVILNIPNYVFEFVYFTPHIFLCALSFFIVKRLFNDKQSNGDVSIEKRHRSPTKLDLFKTSLPMFGVTLSTAVMSHFDILMLNYYTSSETVGIYAIYAKIVIITTLASQSINSMFAPTVSKLHSTNKKQQLRSFAKKTTLLSFSVTLILTLGFIVIHKPFLTLYGPQFLTELPTLYILILGSLCAGFCGPVGLFLNMTGHQNVFFKIISFAAILNVILNILLIPKWGAPGAAAATFISMAAWNILATKFVLTEFRYTILWTRTKLK